MTIADCQAEILEGLKAEKHPSAQWYESRYAPAEPHYWAPVVPWIDALQLPSSILDIGAAYGTLLVYCISKFWPQRAVVLDTFRNLPVAIERKYGIMFLRGNAELENLPGGQFDLILMTEVLEHFNFCPIPTLAKIRLKLAPGGTLILSTPDAASWGKRTVHYESWRDMPIPNRSDKPLIDGHIWHYSEEDLAEIFQRSKLLVVKHEKSPGVAARHLCYMLKSAEDPKG